MSVIKYTFADAEKANIAWNAAVTEIKERYGFNTYTHTDMVLAGDTTRDVPTYWIFRDKGNALEHDTNAAIAHVALDSLDSPPRLTLDSGYSANQHLFENVVATAAKENAGKLEPKQRGQ